MKSLSELTIKDGDLICFGGTTYLSRLIKWHTQSIYSHAALCVVLRGRVYLLESMDGGIRLFPLDGCLEKAIQDGYIATYFKLKSGFDGNKIVEEGLKLWSGKWQKRYWIVPIITQWGHLIKRFLTGNTNVVKDCYQCSEFVSYALQNAGIKLPKLPILMTPKLIANLDCFETGIMLY